MKTKIFITVFSLLIYSQQALSGITVSFDTQWRFTLSDSLFQASDPSFNDDGWRVLDLPHDWSIEGTFEKDNPSTVGGGALPGGIGWYRKTFFLPESDVNKLVFIDFDGVYRNSEVWINGHSLGIRPYGYSSFRYELTPYLKYGKEKNIIAVRVDNSQQPNSRWYSGSGIYRNVWLVTTDKIHVEQWGTFITTPEVNNHSAKGKIHIAVKNSNSDDQTVEISTAIFDADHNATTTVSSPVALKAGFLSDVVQTFAIQNPHLWSVENPILYKAVTSITINGRLVDEYTTSFGFRFFAFDREKGFSLNGKPLKIDGVCNHHDLGCLGSAVNTRAIERQLEILKAMGVNGIRTSHNPPAPELLDLCDKMGFIVMDEAFDMWKKGKTKYDYSLDWDTWHQRDLEDMVRRDRNHPSVFIWSIGNEVTEQYDRKDSSGTLIARELVSIVKNLDPTRPVTSNLNDPDPMNPVIRANALDLIGFSYHQNQYATFLHDYPGQILIGSETVSALETRGSYDMPSDSIRRWPARWDLPVVGANPDNSCSAYDNCSAPWGSTHEETWKLVKKLNFVSGQYIWTGFDYLGEPTPYDWPSRSSYFGIVDLAGFPKDVYYMYQSEWTTKPVLHIFPHWNWKQGDTVDVWAYTNCDEVELFVNGKSLGTKKKTGDDLHLMWRVPFEPGAIVGIARTGGKEILRQEVSTAGPAAKILMHPDRQSIHADGKDLSFITVDVVDANGTLAPYAENEITFSISGEGKIVGVDNGSETSHEPFKASFRKAFHGKCLVVVQSTTKAGNTHGYSRMCIGLTTVEH